MYLQRYSEVVALRWSRRLSIEASRYFDAENAIAAGWRQGPRHESRLKSPRVEKKSDQTSQAAREIREWIGFRAGNRCSGRPPGAIKCFVNNCLLMFHLHLTINVWTVNWLSFLNRGVVRIGTIRKGREGTRARICVVNQCTINDLRENPQISLFFAFIVCFWSA